MKHCGDIETKLDLKLAMNVFPSYPWSEKGTVLGSHELSRCNKKQERLKNFEKDMGENAINGISETWLRLDEDLLL